MEQMNHSERISQAGWKGVGHSCFYQILMCSLIVCIILR